MNKTQVDETKYGYVYRITNLINSKTYVGQHKVIKNENWLSYMGSGRLVRYAIHKYGVENFSKELLSYANSKEELDILEKSFIEKELVKGHSEYNINGSDAKLAIRLDELDLNNEDLLKWYFDEKMSYPEIAFRIGCSVPTIFNYMKKFRDKDERFKSIRQGDSRGKNFFNKEAHEKASKITHSKVECENCSKHISHSNYETHLEACLSDDYFDGFRKHKCATADCNILIYKKNTYCKKHYLENGFKGVATTDTVKKGGIIASHNRWHVARGKVSEKCELCQENSEA